MAEIPALTEMFSASTAKTYTSFLKDVDIRTALTCPDIITAMFQEKNYSQAQIDNAFKALRSIAKLLLRDTKFDSSFVHEQYRINPKVLANRSQDRKKEKDDDALTILLSDEEDEKAVPTKSNCPHCADLIKLLTYCALHLADDAKTPVIEKLLKKVYG